MLEPNSKFHENFKEKCISFFRSSGYLADISLFTNETEMRKFLSSKNVDVVISDLSFDSEDLSGLLVVKKIKEEFPDIFVIGFSRANIGYRDVSARLPTFDMFIEKTGFIGGNDRYILCIVDEFKVKFKRNSDIVISEKTEYRPNEQVKIRDFESMVSQIMFRKHSSDERSTPSKVYFKPLSGGRSSSSVYKMYGENINGDIVTVPSVLKISPINNAIKEKENYDEFVKWILPYKWRVDMLGFGITKKFGAICYSFISSIGVEYDSLTKYILDGKDDVIINSIKTVFSPEKRHWYSESFIEIKDDINKRYHERYFNNQNDKNNASAKFNKYTQDLFDAKLFNQKVKIFNNYYSKPIERLFGEPNGSYSTCICHGDLNSNNLIVSENGEVIFIDFQNTGRGHVFEDFVTLEASIRLNYPLQIDQHSTRFWNSFIDSENKCVVGDCNQEDDLPNLHRHIYYIRRLAKLNFPNENFKLYYYAVAAFNTRLLLLSKLTDSQFGRIISCILVALEQLDK
ncbi:MAG: phosphotransferase [Magnetococcales bacterium]|nr:phosphotransferase [Magnetococcales bacterium]